MLVLTLAALLASTPSAPREVSVVIWGGGTTDDEARAIADTWDDRNTTWGTLFTLADGFPKVLPSTTWPELKPGLFVVVLGLCEKASPAVEAIDALEPNLYEKRVTTAEAASCPRFTYDDDTDPSDEALRWGLAKDGVQTVGALRVVVLTGSYSQMGDFASSMSGVRIVASRRKGSALLEEKVTELGGDYDSLAEVSRVRAVDKKVVVEWNGASPTCAKMNSEARTFDAETTVLPSLKVSTRKSKAQTQHCDWETEKSFYAPREE